MKKLIPYLMQHKGATTKDGFTPLDITKGYAVGIIGYKIDMKVSTSTELEAKINTLLELKQEDDFIGYWLQDNIIYIDIVKIIQDLNQALKLGMFHKQEAIYDCKLNKEITINYENVGKSFQQLKSESRGH